MTRDERLELPYRAIWEREVGAGLFGQDRRKPGTWRHDALYRAMLWQIQADESEALLASALDNGAHPDTIAGLLRDVEDFHEKAHAVFVAESKVNDAA